MQHFIFFVFIICGYYELGVSYKHLIIDIYNGYGWNLIYGTFDNPAPFAMFITMILSFVWFYVLHIRVLTERGNLLKKLEVILSCLYALLSLAVIVLCMNRTSWLAAAASISIVTYCHMKSMHKNVYFILLKNWLSIFALTMIMLFGIIGVYLIKKTSADGRLLIWEISSSIMKENIINGVGRGKFASVYGNAQEEYFRNNKGTKQEEFLAGAPDHAYNEYLQIIIEHGIVGLLLLIFVMGYSFYHIKHINSQIGIPIMGAFISLLVMSFFSYPLRNLYTFMLSMFIVMLSMFIPNKEGNYKKMIIKYIFLFLVYIIVSFKVCLLYGAIGNKKTAYEQWGLLKPYFELEQIDDIIENYSILYSYLKSDAAFLFEYGQCLSKTGKYEQSNQIMLEGLCISGDPMFLNIMGKNYQRLGRYQLAEEMFKKAHYRIPHKVYPLYLLMLLYKEMQNEQSMINMAYRVVNHKEKIISVEAKYLKEKAREILYQYEIMKR